MTALWCVTATADLALSAGLYGTSGTYNVDSCINTSHTRKNSDYDCYGKFTPDGGTAVYVHLKDTGHDYQDGTEFEARQGLDPQTIQRVGFWGIVGELWQVALCVAILGCLAYQAMKPRGESRRRESRSRQPAGRQRVANRMGYVVVVAIPVGILSWIAMAAEPTL
ncbi:hypothetical protein AB0N07_47220 [Streptomyces sp. NPDC051172]|uniref:hypothetical protein n=1 Tax=Streptomyces sp. NPDC051172 TaxID=3155796 RepID=UPI0034120553